MITFERFLIALNRIARIGYLAFAVIIFWFAAMSDSIIWTLGLITIGFGIFVVVIDDHINNNADSNSE